MMRLNIRSIVKIEKLNYCQIMKFIMSVTVARGVIVCHVLCTAQHGLRARPGSVFKVLAELLMYSASSCRYHTQLE